MNLKIKLYFPIYRRYEIEYDENRLEIGYDIARRFLGIELENNPNSDRQCGDEVVLQITDSDDLNKNSRRNSSSNEATAPKPETAPNVSTTNAINNTITTSTAAAAPAAANTLAAAAAAATAATASATTTTTITPITAASSVAQTVSNTINATATATTTHSTTSANKLSKENVNADASNDEVGSKCAHTTDNNKAISKDMHLNCEKSELVLDVLNDDLIEKVRGRITCKSRCFVLFAKMSFDLHHFLN